MRKELGVNAAVRPMTVRSGMPAHAVPGSCSVAGGMVRRVPEARRSWRKGVAA